ncbi:MAG: hypothetical protein JWR87_3427 [Segetibacter sp.]|nr:hypothetical protein [Segetibacter sp.]
MRLFLCPGYKDIIAILDQKLPSEDKLSNQDCQLIFLILPQYWKDNCDSKLFIKPNWIKGKKIKSNEKSSVFNNINNNPYFLPEE